MENLVEEQSRTIEFPLRGEWRAVTSPADKVPSHGTNRLGLRHAFDFVKVNEQKHKKIFFGMTKELAFLVGRKVENYYCYGQPIFAPYDGEIVEIVNQVKDPKQVHCLPIICKGIQNARIFNNRKGNFSQLAGNYVVIKGENETYAVFAHLQKDSMQVHLRQKIKQGDFIAKVGHTGNSTEPHLHFQLMDHADFSIAKGLPVQFEEYERYQDCSWKSIFGGVPSKKDRFRYRKNSIDFP